MLKKITLRFYEELNDFLPSSKRKKRFEHTFIDRTSVKDMIESIGIPHTEVDLIIVNGNSVNFNYLIKDKDDISVYPVFESLDISSLQHLRPRPLRKPKFILDVHLGTLAKYMRMLGLDTFYRNDYMEEVIVKLSVKEKRTILTKDRSILKRTEVTHGYWVRNTKILEQLNEVLNRFDLKKQFKELSRCLQCNSVLKKVKKEVILKRLPQKVKEFHNEFYYCDNCDKIFWKGSHYTNMMKVIEKLILT